MTARTDRETRTTALSLAVELVRKSGSAFYEADTALKTAASFEEFIKNGATETR